MVGKAVLMRSGHRVLRLWWRLRKPSTYGVKVLVLHPSDPERCLVVRHSYVDQHWWGLPGGGYKPHKETAEAAAAREVFEELSLPISKMTVLETLTTNREGKVDSLTILSAESASEDFKLSLELTEARWVSTDLTDLPADAAISQWLQRALTANKRG
ncbi:NUDIX domain-containing protein [Kribbella sp. CA-294648]|uniref:NUDIX domain-containing protein n=1 Tax=Kribbella sp. CA-294648 TaxID=3239948 RepID=UPI003D93E1F7